MVIGKYMDTQNYLMVNESTNIVENTTVWDGNTNTWQPPTGYLMLVENTTPAMVWEPIFETNPVTQKQVVIDWVLTQQIGQGQIGFTWDGSVLTTNQPKPAVPTQS